MVKFSTPGTYVNRTKRSGRKKYRPRSYTRRVLSARRRAPGTLTLRPRRRLSYRRNDNWMNPFPEKNLVKHKYADNVTMPAAAGAGQAQIYTFMCNGMYDPDVTGTGHQPMFRDEMVAKYEAYTVLSSKIGVFFPMVDTAFCNFFIVVTQDSTPEVIYPTNALEEYKFNRPEAPAYRSSTLVKKAYFNAAKRRGTTVSGILADDTFKSTASSDPNSSARWYYHIIVYPVDSTVTLTARRIQVQLTYHTLWRDTKDFTAS